jgi:hypothetical protein
MVTYRTTTHLSMILVPPCINSRPQIPLSFLWLVLQEFYSFYSPSSLCFYCFSTPQKIFQRILLANCVHNRLRIFLYTFIEKFHFCYRDGLNGTKDTRSFSGIYFLLRILIYTAAEISMITLKFNQLLVQGFVFSITALLIALSRPYKRTAMTIIDSVLLLHMTTICSRRLNP